MKTSAGVSLVLSKVDASCFQILHVFCLFTLINFRLDLSNTIIPTVIAINCSLILKSYRRDSAQIQTLLRNFNNLEPKSFLSQLLIIIPRN